MMVSRLLLATYGHFWWLVSMGFGILGNVTFIFMASQCCWFL